MKGFLFVVCCALIFSACDESEVRSALDTVNKIASTAESVQIPSTGVGQLDAAIAEQKADVLYTNRKIVVMNAFTGDTIWAFTGRARITRTSTNGDVTIHYIDEAGQVKKRDFIGSSMNVMSEQL